MGNKIRNITVFCGSSTGTGSVYEDGARKLAEHLTERGIRIVYGGAKVGLMGILADRAMELGGHVTGVIPRFLQSKEIRHDGLSTLIHAETMHERKSVMNDFCDAVIAMPGGFGTMDELFEMVTWAQLGLHQKPIGLLNVNGFFDELLVFLDKMVKDGFLNSDNRKIILDAEDPGKLLKRMEKYKAAEVPKWILKDQL